MIHNYQLKEALDLLFKSKCSLDFKDYVNIWGDSLGLHIWRQEGSDILRIWGSGLTNKQKDQFTTYIEKKFKTEKINNDQDCNLCHNKATHGFYCQEHKDHEQNKDHHEYCIDHNTDKELPECICE